MVFEYNFFDLFFQRYDIFFVEKVVTSKIYVLQKMPNGKVASLFVCNYLNNFALFQIQYTKKKETKYISKSIPTTCLL